MTSASREERFARFAERELNIGQRRDPIWRQVLADANNDPSKAKASYVKARVAMLLEEEKEFEDSNEALKTFRKFNDQMGLSLQKRLILFGGGIILVLWITLYWLLLKRH